MEGGEEALASCRQALHFLGWSSKFLDLYNACSPAVKKYSPPQSRQERGPMSVKPEAVKRLPGLERLKFGGSHEPATSKQRMSGFRLVLMSFTPRLHGRPPAQARPQVHIIGPRQQHHLKKGCRPMVRSEHPFPTICH